ncbi:MAG: amidohydrolase [bacterium]
MMTAFVHGAVFTPDALRGKGEPAEAVLVEDGKIAAVGKTADIRNALKPDDTTIDLQGQLMYPGFIDAHTHLGSYGTRLRQLDLHNLMSLQAALAKIEAYARTLEPGEWLVGRGWDESRWPENRYITRADLDPSTPQNPALVLRVDGHLGAFNSIALRALGILESDASDGILKESALDSARGKIQPTVAERKEDILQAIQKAHELGVTGIGEIATREDFHAFLELWKSRQLKLRVNLIPLWEIWGEVCKMIRGEENVPALQEYEFPRKTRDSLRSPPPPEGRQLGDALSVAERAFGDDTLTIRGIKFFADGSIGARTALLSDDYADAPGVRGQPYLDLPVIEEGIRTVVAAGFQPVTHAIGDAAIERVVSIYERVLSDTPHPSKDSGQALHLPRKGEGKGEGKRLGQDLGFRPRIEHFEMPSIEHIERLKSVGGIASMQPNFIGEWGLPGAMYEQRLGHSRWERMNPLWEIQRRGLPMCFGSDMMPFSPLYGIRCALMSPVRRQQIKEREAILAYTEGGACAAFMEHRWGKIGPGYCADFVVLDDSPSEMANVRMTVFGGEIVYRKAL